MGKFRKQFILIFLAGMVFSNEPIHGAIKTNVKSDKDAVLVLTQYTKNWDYYESELGVVAHITTRIGWKLHQPGNYFWDECLVFEDIAPIYNYGWLDLRWDKQGNGWAYGFPLPARDVACGNRDYSNPNPLTGYIPSTPSRICHGGTFRARYNEYGEPYEEIVNREEKVVYELHTGTRGFPGRQNLFVFGGTATAYSDLFYPEIDPYSGSYPINPTAIQIGELGSLSSDGLLCVALGNGTTRDVTPKISASRYYAFGVAAGKYLFQSQVSCVPPGNTNVDRTTVGVGENVLMYFDPAPPVTPVWTATAGTLAGVGSQVVFTAPGVGGDATVTATVRGVKLAVDFNVLEPTGFDHADIASTVSYATGVAGAGMHLNVYLAPTTVSFNAVQVMEVGQAATDISGYFTDSRHTPPNHDSSTLANQWYSVGCDNLILNNFDNAYYSGMPPSWSLGGFRWPIPVVWKVGNGPTNSLTSWEQVFTLQADGMFTVSKFGHSVTRTINNFITTQ